MNKIVTISIGRGVAQICRHFKDAHTDKMRSLTFHLVSVGGGVWKDRLDRNYTIVDDRFIG